MSPFAMLFPGQGSQSLGMLSDLAPIYDVIQSSFKEASTALGYDLWQLVTEGPEEVLNQTVHTQPALLCAGVALWRVWQQYEAPAPHYLAGHSLGEYTALVCANAIDFKDAINLVALRGRFMQEAVKPGEGAMAAIVGLSNEEVEELCNQAAQGEVVSPANYNSLGQIVIAGHTAAVSRAIELAKEKGAKLAKLIPVSVPSHCALMKPAAERLAASLEKVSISKPQWPIIHNVDAKSHHDAASIRKALIQQLDHPVRWVETIQELAKNDCLQGIECGPGKVLAGLNKRIVGEFTTYSLATKTGWDETLKAFHLTSATI
jgi:[acyl-carrier-protein] S-malonyltransferase